MTAAAQRVATSGDRTIEAQLAAGLAVAAGQAALTFVALPAPVVGAGAIAGVTDEVFREQPRVAWSSGTLTLAGLGAARELRGHGEARWQEVIAAAATVAQAVIDGARVELDALGFARPRFVGGAAFAPGAADRAPWTGFGDAWFVLPRWTYVHDGHTARLVLAVDGEAARDEARWRGELAVLVAAFAPRALRPQPALVELQGGSAAEWRQQILDITDAIAAGTCSKIVAARTATIALAGPVRLGDLLGALDERQPETVRVMIQPPGAGTLIAATPERLVGRDGDVVTCDALAGTHRIAANDDAGREHEIAEAGAVLLASAKERNEHALVVQALHEALADCADVDAPEVPRLRVLRQLVHLHTPFRARLRAPRHVLELVARLHPTPAVGGVPHALAAEWIRTREAARGWYASPVGWFDLDGNGELAVAIRSGVFAGNRGQLWAGGGIVAGSDPDRELAETELKLRALLGALGVAPAEDATP